MRKRTLAPLLLLLGSCASPSKQLETMYQESLADMVDRNSRVSVLRFARTRQKRADAVRDLIAEDELTTNLDRLHAASILLDSDRAADIDLAADIALAAAQAGDDRGFPLAAEAIDRSLMKRGRPQKYGTQYVHVPSAGWVLYRWDESVTDAERASMGVPSIAEAKERLRALNE